MLILISLILCIVKSQYEISCGEIKKGIRGPEEKVEFVFIAETDYEQVYLESCDSDHDIILDIEDKNGNVIVTEDDRTDTMPGQCNYKNAPAITIPGYVSTNDEYSFIVKGYRRREGNYTVQLFCEEAYTAPGPAPSPSDCPRERKEWNTAFQWERDLYINGLLQLSQDGILQKFTQQHGASSANYQAHSTSAFLPWHRQFLFELETQIRNLGGEYACFALLYWNWGLDVDQSNGNYDSYSIMQFGLGGRGDPNDNYCVTDGNFRVGQYTPSHCPDSWRSKSTNECCLRRVTWDNDVGTDLWRSTQDSAAIHEQSYGSDTDPNDNGVNDQIQTPHGRAHCRFGGCGRKENNYIKRGHLGHPQYSPDDPIFYLLHTHVDYMWALWQDYNDYEQVDKSQITDNIYNGNFQNSGVDDVMVFDVLVKESWSTLRGNEVIRDVHSIRDMGYKYEYGSFIDNVDFPTSYLDNNWFYEDETRRRRRRRLKDDSMRFDQLAYQQLVRKSCKDDVNTYDGRRKLAKTLAKMSCDFANSGGYECERPAYFDDCSDMERGPNIYNDKMDINITLDELIEKVSDYPCMVETRELMYGFVAELGGLWKLCRGDYDRFCDQEFLGKRPKKNQCEARGYSKNKKKKKKGYVF